MSFTLSRKRAEEAISRYATAESINIIIGNAEGTYGLRQFYRNPHLSPVLLNLQSIETALRRIVKGLQSDGYTLRNFLDDTTQQAKEMDALRRICVEEKHSSYLYSNRYRNEAENPWTQISSFLDSSVTQLGALLDKAEAARSFSN